MRNRNERWVAQSLQQRKPVLRQYYDLTGKGGQPLRIDVVPMRRWAEKHAELVSIPLDIAYVERLLARAAVTEQGVHAVMARMSPKPILLCRDINDDGDEIVDGNHTYVALAIAWAKGQQAGLVPAGPAPGVPAFCLVPQDWGRFVVDWGRTP